MTPEDLKQVTGRSRYGKQAEWFKISFGIDVMRTFDGAPIMTWVLYETLLARRAGIESTDNNAAAKRSKICSPFA